MFNSSNIERNHIKGINVVNHTTEVTVDTVYLDDINKLICKTRVVDISETVMNFILDKKGDIEESIQSVVDGLISSSRYRIVNIEVAVA